MPPPGSGIRRILACVDRSPFSEVGLPYAIFLSKTLGSAITLLHVMQAPQNGPLATDALGWEISRQEASVYLERLEREVSLASGHPVDTLLAQGQPAERISAVAHEVGADLTVLGSHGQGGATAWKLGSTAQQVLAIARGSVFIARSTSAVSGAVSPKRILVPLDGAVRTESVLPIAVRIARAHGAELLLVHVVNEPLPTAVLSTTEDLALARELASRLQAGATRYLERVREHVAHEVATRPLVVRHPDELQSLVDLTKSEGIDLVVLSAHGSICNPERAFGSVAAYLLTHSMVPLLVLQDLPETGGEVGEEPAPLLRASYPPEDV